MAAMNENLVYNVFDEMVKNKPSLAKFLPDKDQGEEADYRLIADQVVKNFPWPVGVELRRLFSGSMRQLDRMRLDQIFKTIERSMQFLSFVMLSQMVKEKTAGKITVPEHFSKEFSNRFLVLSMGNFSWLIRSIGNIFEEQKGEW